MAGPPGPTATIPSGAPYRFCRRHRIDVVRFGDGIACVTPFGLGFGRVANFINGEIWGKQSTAPWAVIPCNQRMRDTLGQCPHGEVPLHPVQLYEAFLEGVVLFLILFALTRIYKGLRRPGLATGTFLILYAVFRIFVEVMFRDSDNKIPGLPHWFTVGVLFSAPMPIIGLLFLWNAFQDRVGKVPFAPALARLMSSAPAAKRAPDGK